MPRKHTANEIWAVLDETGKVMYSRGGSSTTRRLMTYPTKEKAEAALRNPWIKQVIPNRNDVRVICIYKS